MMSMPAPTPTAEAQFVMCPQQIIAQRVENGVTKYLYYGPVCGIGMMTSRWLDVLLDPIGDNCPAENCRNHIVIGRLYDELDPTERDELVNFVHGRGSVFANPHSQPVIPAHDLRLRGLGDYDTLDAPIDNLNGGVADQDRIAVRYDQLDGCCTCAVLFRTQPPDAANGAKTLLSGHELAPGTPADETARLVMRFGYCDVVECRGEFYTVARRRIVPRSQRAILDMKFENFWHEFNRLRLHAPPLELYVAATRGYASQGLTYDGMVDELRKSVAGANHPATFAARIRVSADGPRGLLDMAHYLMAIADRHLSGPFELRAAFEAFGQGILYDARTPCSAGQCVHMVEGTPQNWKGYHRWYAFFRAVSLLGDPSRDWLHIARCIGLAWAIQTEAQPTPDDPSNPGLPESRLTTLRNTWFQLSFEQLDQAFAQFAGAAPTESQIPAAYKIGRYRQIQLLLSAAAGTAQPDHDGYGRFWELPWIDFMNMGPIETYQVIAPPGPNRGARSAMVLALKGQLIGVPPMPLGQTPLTDAQIQLVETWIDDDCPEF